MSHRKQNKNHQLRERWEKSIFMMPRIDLVVDLTRHDREERLICWNNSIMLCRFRCVHSRDTKNTCQQTATLLRFLTLFRLALKRGNGKKNLKLFNCARESHGDTEQKLLLLAYSTLIKNVWWLLNVKIVHFMLAHTRGCVCEEWWNLYQ